MNLPDYDPATYGDRMAEVYDGWFDTPGDANEAVIFLSELAGRGPVLELGIGTGRVALPLVEKGVEVDRVFLETSRYDPVNQRVYSQNIAMSESQTKLYPVKIRYAWPSELDLMARLAGLRLRERFGGWRREPFTASSTGHVSVYEKDPSAIPADG